MFPIYMNVTTHTVLIQHVMTPLIYKVSEVIKNKNRKNTLSVFSTKIGANLSFKIKNKHFAHLGAKK